MDTPFFEKSKTYLGVEPQPVPPVYAPDVVSEVILHAAQHPVRDFIAGGSGAKFTVAQLAPRLADRYMERWTFDSQRTTRPVNGRADNLYQPVAEDGGERGRNWDGHTRKRSLYTKALLYPRVTAGIAGGLRATLALTLATRRLALSRRRQPSI